MHEEKVYTMPAAAINEINELHIQNALNKKIKAYSTHIDVIDAVEKGLFGCGEGCAPNKNSVVLGRAGYNNKSFEYKMKIKYYHYGLGTDMDSKVDVLDQSTVTTTWNSATNQWVTTYTEVESQNIYLFGVMSRKYKIKCGSESGMYQLPLAYRFDTSLRIQSYSLRKCLTKYYATANFQYKFLSTDFYYYFDPADGFEYPLTISHGY